MSTSRRRKTAALLVALLLVSGCSAAHPPSRNQRPSLGAPQPSTRTSAGLPPPDGRASQTAPANPLASSFAALSPTIAATVGIAVASGGRTAQLQAFGTWSTGVAWSTIKVPLAIAAERSAAQTAEQLIAQAITESDNAAAEQLWSILGEPTQAAHAVENILREGGDQTTMVQSQRVRPPFTAFGQTVWPLSQEAVFAAHLPCLADSANVINQMRNVEPSQRWGLAAINGVAAKGGWGPGETGGYLVRQLGTLATPSGWVGIALAAIPFDGSFDGGVKAINALSEWVDNHRQDLRGARC